MQSKATPAGRVMIRGARLSFPALFRPEAFNAGDEPKFKATLLIPKGDPQAKDIERAILAVLKDKHPTKAEQILKSIRSNPNKFCVADGDTKSYDGYEGMLAISAKSKSRPTVVDQLRNPLAEEDGKPYAGCYVNASLDFFAYDSSGVGVSASLRGVQFVRDGESFGGGGSANADEFDEVTVEDDVPDFL